MRMMISSWSNPYILNKCGVVPEAILAGVPSKIILAMRELKRFRRCQGKSCAFLQFILKPVDAKVIQCILQACQFPVAAVAVVALDGKHFIHGLQCLLFTVAEADHRSQPGIGLFAAVCRGE